MKWKWRSATARGSAGAWLSPPAVPARPGRTAPDDPASSPEPTPASRQSGPHMGPRGTERHRSGRQGSSLSQTSRDRGRAPSRALIGTAVTLPNGQRHAESWAVAPAVRGGNDRRAPDSPARALARNSADRDDRSRTAVFEPPTRSRRHPGRRCGHWAQLTDPERDGGGGGPRTPTPARGHLRLARQPTGVGREPPHRQDDPSSRSPGLPICRALSVPPAPARGAEMGPQIRSVRRRGGYGARRPRPAA